MVLVFVQAVLACNECDLVLRVIVGYSIRIF